MNENLENKFICKYCGRTFKRQCDLTQHIKIKHLGIKYQLNKNSKRFIKIKCPNCGKDISSNQFNRHYKSCISKKQKIKNKDAEEIFNKCIIQDNKYICPICNKKFNKFGIKMHIWRMHTSEGNLFNPNKGYINGVRHAWNKGLTKDSDERINKSVNTYKYNKLLGLHKSHYNQFWSKESRRKLRDAAIRRCLGGVRQTKKILYNGFKLGSTYEVKLAKDLDTNNIKWIIPKRIKYIDINNKIHYYTPDFYLPDYNIYLDPKNDFLINNINPKLGYKDSDKINWVCKQNNIKIFILNKDQLNWKYIKENLLNNNAPLV